MATFTVRIECDPSEDPFKSATALWYLLGCIRRDEVEHAITSGRTVRVEGSGPARASHALLNLDKGKTP